MAVARAGEEGADAAGADFLEWLGPDTSAVVFALLRDPADIASAAAVSRSWRTLVMAVHLSKIQCLRICPDVAIFSGTEQATTSASGDINEEDAAASAWEGHKRESRAYTRLAHALLAPYASESCIRGCIAASSTDVFPDESIENTLDPRDHEDLEPLYWGSSGQADTEVPEFLLYQLCSDLCLIHEIKIRPFRAFFQFGGPIYSSRYVRFRMGCPKMALRPEDLVSNENEGKLTADANYIWTYTSPTYRMAQMNALQSFKLPRPALCTGGVLKIELFGRVQKQAEDGLYYICVSHVQALGCPLPRELAVAPCRNGVVLKYYLDSETPGDDGHRKSKWPDFEARFWRALTGRRIGLNQELLSRLFGPLLQKELEEDGYGAS